MANLISYEPPTPPLELRDEMDVAATASVGFYIMLALSATLATLGLIANSAAVIIGAMIIAPLMNPIIAFSFSCARGNWRILRKAAFSVATGIVVVLFVSILVTKIVGSRMEGAEVLSRSHPNLIDLGVAIASGIAGAIAWSRRKISNALPGVAIAVALVPPLCTVGIGLALGSSAVRDPLHPHLVEVQNIEFGAALLFLTNFVAILLFGGLVFLVQGYGRLRRAMIGLTISLVAIVVLGFPLASSFKDFLLRSRVMETLSAVRLTVLVGGYAHKHHLSVKTNVTETVQGWRAHAPQLFPLPHPSWRNTAWLKKNAWFAQDLLPELRAKVQQVMHE